MDNLNIYISGVGGQGIGLLSKVLAQACLKAKYDIKSVDTHGLAQRGGTVVSQIRIGEDIYSPLIPKGEADIVIGLERLEALRAMPMLKPEGGRVLYYETQVQPIDVRLDDHNYPKKNELEAYIKKINGELKSVRNDDIPDVRMQNIVLLAEISKLGWIEKVNVELIKTVLKEILPESIKAMNLELFKKLANA
ncbi:MAG: indolepyruvate oxidoreductase subunit beta [Candidatus Marinimicrobia bacterium]|nr:indolepyruvate oxidoreductase subunit beta [Candidatus Neomarinimicrobiota bacterium]